MTTPPLFDQRFHLERRSVNGIELNLRHGGSGPPLLLLHGFPQTHAIWHRVAATLVRDFLLVMPDLRGYGDSSKPATDPRHETYSKRVTAADMLELMRSLGHERFLVCGHDRGGRVAHRLAVDHPQAVARLMVLDISPTAAMYERTTMEFARLYYHWFFLIQPAPLPERLIGADPAFYLRCKLGGWRSAGNEIASGASGPEFFDPRAYAEYERCFTPEAIHAMCEDYRAAASIDLEHDRHDAEHRIECPVHALWGDRGVVHRLFTPIADWQARSRGPVTGTTTASGHYIAEEAPDVLLEHMRTFFGQARM